jgi:hypothetical protein
MPRTLLGCILLTQMGAVGKPEWIRPNIPITSGFREVDQIDPRLGCGFDRMGPATLAS